MMAWIQKTSHMQAINLRHSFRDYQKKKKSLTLGFKTRKEAIPIVPV